MTPPRSSFLFAAFLLLLPGAAFATPPNAPTALTVSFIVNNKLRLDWVDNSTDESGFEIQYRVGTTGTWNSLGQTGPDIQSITLTGTSAGTTFQFQVCAVSTTLPTENSDFAGPITVPVPAYGMSSSTYAAGLPGKAFSFNLVSTKPALVTGYSVSPLPDGLSLNAATGLISGTPSRSGIITGKVVITHSDGVTAYGELSLRIFKPLPALLPPVGIAAIPDQSTALDGGSKTFNLGPIFNDPDVSSAARLITDLGTMDFAFYPYSAPETVDNFIGYATRGDFANTMFHRSIANFIVQGGAFRADATASAVATKDPVVNEPEITNVRGTVAMAKLGGDPDSATNQFFVNLADNSSNLDNQNEGFTVFARVAGGGMAVADAIAALPTKSYSTVNSALTDTPVRSAAPPATYDPTLLVRISSVTAVSPLSFTATDDTPTVAVCSVAGSVLTVSPAGPGETTVSVTATDLDHLTAITSFQVRVNDTFNSWAARQAFASPAEAAPGADPDGDGTINLTEFALTSDPLSGIPSNPVPGLSEGHPTLTFTLRRFMSGVTVTLQTATDPAGPWTDRWKNTDSLTHPWIASNSAAGEVLTVTARDPSPAGSREFMRLKISE